jgi:hypothetical protein
LTLTTAPASQKASASVAAPAAEEESAPLKNDASHQGVKVHGHWKIVVKNQDGSTASTTDFENSLTPTGQVVISFSLAGGSVGSTSGGFSIVLQSTGTSICGKTNCAIVTNTTAGGGFTYCANTQNVACATGMTTSVNSNIVLAGQMTASQAGTVNTVNTILAACPSTVTPKDCGTTPPTVGNGLNPSPQQFTLATLPSAVSVNAGQIVQVTVTLSFS